jgi:mycothiol S-conjugate amidase
MAGSSANENPACFARAPLRHAVGRLVKILRDERPSVVITYASDGGYPHPDHLRVHQVGVEAFFAASDPAQYVDAGPPHEVTKLYYQARSRERLVALADAHDRAGLESPFRSWISDEDDDFHITTRIDVGNFFEVRRDALLAHRTQVSPDSLWMKLPLETARQAYPFEDFTLAYSRVEVRVPEADLFAGIPG